MKTLVIVDIQNLFLASRKVFGPLARIDYVKLKELFKDTPEDTVDAIAYILASPYHDDKKFLKFLKKHDYILFRKFAKLANTNDTNEYSNVQFKNRSWTNHMVWESIKMLPNYQKLVIVSGNGAFCSVIEAAKVSNKPTKVVSFDGTLQSELATLANSVVLLDKAYIFDSASIKSKYTEEENG